MHDAPRSAAPVRSDRFQPQGPVADPARRDPPWLELLRSVPLAVVLGLLGGVFGWGVRYATFQSDGKEQADRIGRLELAQTAAITTLKADLLDKITRLEASSGKELTALRTSLGDQMTRMESTNNLRFDAWDKRGDARMAMLTGRFEKADSRDETILDAMNKLDNRLTRVEALREFTAANGPGKK